MYLLTFHTKPLPSHPEFDETGGAYVNCYIVAEDLEAANKIASEEITANNWRILELDESTIIKSAEDVDPEKLEYYEQALIDKEVFVFYTYPLNEE